mmetsp:Transcript_47413/g.143525  ORF Transcript_47413/g.143525 Transcript_47413/m.143525 type:complete len:212 (-) Transcript_47413:1467-2102(-)
MEPEPMLVHSRRLPPLARLPPLLTGGGGGGGFVASVIGKASGSVSTTDFNPKSWCNAAFVCVTFSQAGRFVSTADDWTSSAESSFPDTANVDSPLVKNSADREVGASDDSTSSLAVNPRVGPIVFASSLISFPWVLLFISFAKFIHMIAILNFLLALCITLCRSNSRSFRSIFSVPTISSSGRGRWCEDLLFEVRISGITVGFTGTDCVRS